METIKKILFMSTIILVSLSLNAQSIKNYTLGEKISRANASSQTRIAGIVGTIYPYASEDGSIYKIEFIPGNKSKTKRSTYREVIKFKKYIERTYNIKLDEISEEDATNKTFSYHLMADYNTAETPPYKINFSISNPSLVDKLENDVAVAKESSTKLVQN